MTKPRTSERSLEMIAEVYSAAAWVALDAVVAVDVLTSDFERRAAGRVEVMNIRNLSCCPVRGVWDEQR